MGDVLSLAEAAERRRTCTECGYYPGRVTLTFDAAPGAGEIELTFHCPCGETKYRLPIQNRTTCPAKL